MITATLVLRGLVLLFGGMWLMGVGLNQGKGSLMLAGWLITSAGAWLIAAAGAKLLESIFPP